MFGLHEHLGRDVSGLKDRALGEEMDPVRSWVRNVGVVDANVAAQRYVQLALNVHCTDIIKPKIQYTFG